MGKETEQAVVSAQLKQYVDNEYAQATKSLSNGLKNAPDKATITAIGESHGNVNSAIPTIAALVASENATKDEQGRTHPEKVHLVLEFSQEQINKRLKALQDDPEYKEKISHYNDGTTKAMLFAYNRGYTIKGMDNAASEIYAAAKTKDPVKLAEATVNNQEKREKSMSETLNAIGADPKAKVVAVFGASHLGENGLKNLNFSETYGSVQLINTAGYISEQQKTDLEAYIAKNPNGAEEKLEKNNLDRMSYVQNPANGFRQVSPPPDINDKINFGNLVLQSAADADKKAALQLSIKDVREALKNNGVISEGNTTIIGSPRGIPLTKTNEQTR